jgi:hypothetical protein
VAGREGDVRIEPSSALYQEFARLYQIAQEQHPGGEDRWNRELYAITDAKWGGLTPDGTMRLNEELVLKHLTGGELSDDPERQGQALATVLHESKHARAGLDAPNEPNAVRRRESFGLNEGLTELATTEDFADFTQRAGYDNVPQPQPEYAGAVHAGNELLTRATSSEQERSELLHSTIDQPVAMGWDTIADHVVRNELADDVPPDPAHQQAARAHLVNQMAIGEWDGVQHRPGRGPMTADLAKAGVDRAVGQISEHYQNNPGEPYPAKVPNPAAAVSTQVDNQSEQQRAVGTSLAAERSRSIGQADTVDLSKLPPPAADTRVEHRVAAGAQQAAPAGIGERAAAMRFLGDQASAAGAIDRRPELGQGARGAGAPAGAGVAKPDLAKGATPPDRGGRG